MPPEKGENPSQQQPPLPESPLYKEVSSIGLEIVAYLYDDAEATTERVNMFGDFLQLLFLKEKEKFLRSTLEPTLLQRFLQVPPTFLPNNNQKKIIQSMEEAEKEREKWQAYISHQSGKDPSYGRINSVLTSKYDDLVAVCKEEENATIEGAQTDAYIYFTEISDVLIDRAKRGIDG